MQFFVQKQLSESIHLMNESIQTTNDKAGKRKNAMKIDTYHMKFESIQATQNES